MESVRPAGERGIADFGWLKSRHTFSFGDYRDADHMGFGPLRVINEDRVAPGKGFGTHPHANMEILSWVLEGTLEHKDSMGTGAQIKPGEMQRMTAGTGVWHSEFNASNQDPVHFLQIWIFPDKQGLAPGYEQTAFTAEELANQWKLVASGKPTGNAVKIHQDVDLYVARPGAGEVLAFAPKPGQIQWLQVARGKVEVEVDGRTLEAGDGASWTQADNIVLRATVDSEVLLFDMIR